MPIDPASFSTGGAPRARDLPIIDAHANRTLAALVGARPGIADDRVELRDALSEYVAHLKSAGESMERVILFARATLTRAGFEQRRYRDLLIEGVVTVCIVEFYKDRS